MEKYLVGRQASDKTLLLAERRLVKRLREEMREVQDQLFNYRQRATKAEQELAEWKKRFDNLLSRTPPLPAVASGVATSVNCGCIAGAEVSCQSTVCPRRFPQSYVTTVSAGASRDE